MAVVPGEIDHQANYAHAMKIARAALLPSMMRIMELRQILARVTKEHHQNEKEAHTRRARLNEMLKATGPVAVSENKTVGMMLRNLGSIKIITRKNLKNWTIWEKLQLSQIDCVRRNFTLQGPKADAPFIYWIWSNASAEVQELAPGSRPEANETLTVKEYLEQFKKTMRPEGPTGMARYHFQNEKQKPDESPVAYWQRLGLLYDELNSRDEKFFVEIFTIGLCNNLVRDEFIRKGATTKEECRIKVVAAVANAVKILKSSKRKDPDLTGIVFASQVANNSFKSFLSQDKKSVIGRPLIKPVGAVGTKNSLNSISEESLNVINNNEQLCQRLVDTKQLFHTQPNDKHIRNNESEELRKYWEASLPDCGQTNCAMDIGCWSCGNTHHSRSQCPARREGARGRTMVQLAGRCHRSLHKNEAQRGFRQGSKNSNRP